MNPNYGKNTNIINDGCQDMCNQERMPVI